MFGMGGSEIIVILIIALIFLGPDKLPEATKAISKGIRDLKKGSRTLQQTIENDEHIGGAIRDLKSALRGEEPVVRPKPVKKKPAALTEGDALAAEPGNSIAGDGPQPAAPVEHVNGAEPAVEAKPDALATPLDAPLVAEAVPSLRLPETAGEAEPVEDEAKSAGEELAAMIRPAEGTVAKGSEPKHG